MKIFVFLTLASVAMAAKPGLCGGGYKDGIDEMKGTVRNGVNLIFGHCYSFDINALVLNRDAPCNNLFRKGFCYGNRAAERYAGLEAGDVNWDLIGADIGNMAILGNLLCSDARACFEAVGDALVACHDADEEGFKSGVYRALEGLYAEQGAEAVTNFQEESEYAVVRQLIGLGLNNVRNLQQVEDFVRSYVSEDVESDAKTAYEKASQAASDFCDAGCVDLVAEFASGLIESMTEDGVCVNVYPFCGGCADRAAEGINDIPCCLVDVIKLGIEGFQYAKENYGERYENVKAYFEENLDDAALAEVQAVVAKARAEFQCVKDVYSNVDGCDSEAA